MVVSDVRALIESLEQSYEDRIKTRRGKDMKRIINLQKRGKASLGCFFFALCIMAYIFVFSSNVNAESCGFPTLLLNNACPDGTQAEVVGLGLIYCCGYGCDYFCNNCGSCRKPESPEMARRYCAYNFDFCSRVFALFIDECQRRYDECLKEYHVSE